MQKVNQGVEYVYQHPEIVSKVPEKILGALLSPYPEACNNGHPGQALGRWVIDFGSFFFALGEIGKLGKTAELIEVTGKAGKTAELTELYSNWLRIGLS